MKQVCTARLKAQSVQALFGVFEGLDGLMAWAERTTRSQDLKACTRLALAGLLVHWHGEGYLGKAHVF